MSPKPLGKRNYGSIPHLMSSKLGEGDRHIHPGQNRIATENERKGDRVIVLEKYDGTNVGVCKVDGNIFPLSRSGYLASESAYPHIRDFASWAISQREIWDQLLNEGERIVGEWMQKRISVKYDIVGAPFVAFDMFDTEGNRIPWNEQGGRLYGFPFKGARCLHRGSAISPYALMSRLNKKDPLIKAENPEGMIYRIENDKGVDFLAKWVRHDFVPGVFLEQNVMNNFHSLD